MSGMGRREFITLRVQFFQLHLGSLASPLHYTQVAAIRANLGR
jgi:hypothetical protein